MLSPLKLTVNSLLIFLLVVCCQYLANLFKPAKNPQDMLITATVTPTRLINLHLGQLIQGIKEEAPENAYMHEINERERLMYACNPLIPTPFMITEPSLGSIIVYMKFSMHYGVAVDDYITMLNLREKVYVNRPLTNFIPSFVIGLGNLAVDFLQNRHQESAFYLDEFKIREQAYSRDPLLPDYLNLHKFSSKPSKS
jgi:hypothetical protein